MTSPVRKRSFIAISILVVGVVSYLVVFRDMWEKENRPILLAIKADAESLVVQGRFEDASARYRDLFRVLGNRNIRDKSFEQELNKAQEDAAHLSATIALKSRTDDAKRTSLAIKAIRIANTQPLDRLETSIVQEERPALAAKMDIFHAAEAGALERVRELLISNPAFAREPFPGERSLTPLHVAANAAIARLLITAGADVNDSKNTKYSQSPLHVAAGDGRVDVMEVLVASGADVNARDNQGWTPLFCAAEAGKLEATKFLLEKGADVHAGDVDGNTVLHVAITTHTNLAVLSCLLSHGAVIDALNVARQTPIDVAVSKKQREIGAFLFNKGGSANQ